MTNSKFLVADFVNQTSHHFKNSVIQQTSSSSTKFNITSTYNRSTLPHLNFLSIPYYTGLWSNGLFSNTAVQTKVVLQLTLTTRGNVNSHFIQPLSRNIIFVHAGSFYSLLFSVYCILFIVSIRFLLQYQINHYYRYILPTSSANLKSKFSNHIYTTITPVRLSDGVHINDLVQIIFWPQPFLLNFVLSSYINV